MKLFCSAVAFVLIVCSGCDQLRTGYGESRGTVGRLSINGFGSLRSAYENAGYRTRDITRLSDRVKRSEAIVWTPKVLHPIPGEVTEWMESWLGRGGKTLVFIAFPAVRWTRPVNLTEMKLRMPPPRELSKPYKTLLKSTF